MRRLPVYLLLDISGSMRGAPIEAVRLGMKSLVNSLKTDPYALETACISVITFNTEANQIVPLTEVYKFQMPTIEAKLGTYIGKALRLLADRIDKEVVKHTKDQKGDWRPLVFIMTDGKSGDKVEKALKEIDRNSLGTIIACAAGCNSRIETLQLLTNTIVQLDNLSESTIKDFFKWVTASITTSSVNINETGSDDILSDLPPLPPGINLVKPTDSY